ncbi:hypothetical protein VaNZ11_005069 [Volvox africanus]|uniref:Uncharacterized protein n=1 Tax=Volvox africanus TaxID=51714 RepID=A0ABQ5RXW5_9CHLO|nr:hypothetical protein VaNZ11_005069 [Volvox africanus]
MRVWNLQEDWWFLADCWDSIYTVTGVETLPFHAPVLSTMTISVRARVWHSRTAHLSYGNLARMAEEDMASDLDVSAVEFRQEGEKAGVCARRFRMFARTRGGSTSTGSWVHFTTRRLPFIPRSKTGGLSG